MWKLFHVTPLPREQCRTSEFWRNSEIIFESVKINTSNARKFNRRHTNTAGWVLFWKWFFCRFKNRSQEPFGHIDDLDKSAIILGRSVGRPCEKLAGKTRAVYIDRWRKSQTGGSPFLRFEFAKTSIGLRFHYRNHLYSSKNSLFNFKSDFTHSRPFSFGFCVSLFRHQYNNSSRRRNWRKCAMINYNITRFCTHEVSKLKKKQTNKRAPALNFTGFRVEKVFQKRSRHGYYLGNDRNIEVSTFKVVEIP